MLGAAGASRWRVAGDAGAVAAASSALVSEVSVDAASAFVILKGTRDAGSVR